MFRGLQPGFKILLFLILTGLFSNVVRAQSTNDVDPSIAGTPANMSPVKLDGKVIFYVRGISSYPSTQRAETIILRIAKAAKKLEIPADSLKCIEDKDVIKIYIGAEFIMNVYPIDAESEGINQQLLADLIAQKTREAIIKYRFERSRPVLIKNIIHAVVASAILIIALLIFVWLSKKISSWLHVHIKSGVITVENSSYQLIRSGQLLKAIMVLSKTLKIILIIAIIIFFLEYILGLFPWTNNIATSTINLIVTPLKTIGNSFVNYLPSLFFLIIIVLVTRYILKLIKLLFTGLDKGGIQIKSFYPEWAMPTYRIVRIFIVAFGIIIAFPYIPGSGSNAFKGVSVFIGVLISLGSSSFIGNLIAGYSMTYRRAFTRGDLIEVNDQKGFVEEQKILVTRLRSFKNEDIVIPNSLMLNSKIINYSSKISDNGLILHTTVGIGYETPWRQVDAMLKLAAERTEGLLKDPPPFVLKRTLGDFAITYEINAFCRDVSNINHHYTILHQNILDVFNENNVQIMTPAYVRDPEIPKVVPKDQWDAPLAE